MGTEIKELQRKMSPSEFVLSLIESRHLKLLLVLSNYLQPIKYNVSVALSLAHFVGKVFCCCLENVMDLVL